jgi:hypothetical protein
VAFNPDLTGCFKSINEPIGHKNLPPLLLHCLNYDRGFTKECFEQFLDLGADISARDYNGRTCLHVCLYNLGPYEVIQQFRAVAFLVERGADPRARDKFGNSVSDYAPYRAVWDSVGRNLGSFRGDLWDAVLQSCGYNISKFREGHRRVGKYTKYYR